MPSPLAALFLPKRRLAAADPLILQRGGLLGGTQWVVPRGECQFRRHDFSAIPPRQRRPAAALHLQRLLPTSDSVARIGWVGSIALFWIWENPLPAVLKTRQKWLPESALRRPVLANGLHLLRCQSGVEGQYWRDGSLVASQWWPDAPALDAWHRFLRGAGVAIDQSVSVPSVQSAQWLDYPWPVMQPVRSGQLANTEFLIWLVTLCLLAAAAGSQASSLHEWGRLREKQQEQLVALRARSGPILDARERAEALAARLQDYRVVQDGISDYDLIAEVIRPLPAGTRLVEYLRDGRKLSVKVALPGQSPAVPASAMGQPVVQPLPDISMQPKLPTVDVRRMVALYAAHPLLDQASATPVLGGVLLEFDLPAPVAGQEPDAGGEAGR